MMFIRAMQAEKPFLHNISKILKRDHNWQGPPCRESGLTVLVRFRDASFLLPLRPARRQSQKALKHLAAQEGNLRRWLEAFSGGTQNSANSCKLCLLSRSSRRFFDLNPQYLSLVWFISTWKEYLDWLWHFSCLFLFYVLLPLFIPSIVCCICLECCILEVQTQFADLTRGRAGGCCRTWRTDGISWPETVEPFTWHSGNHETTQMNLGNWTFVWLGVWKPELCKTLVIPGCLPLNRSVVNVYWHLQY